MFDRVITPLDGSELAEHALSLLAAFMLRPPEELRLVRVVGVDEPETERRRARDYLDALQLPDALRGARVVTEVRVGQDPASEILSSVEANSCGLVVLMTQGKRGISRWLWGSVAERVIRHCPVALLLANPSAGPAPLARIRRILVPLDASPRAAEVLPLVRSVALAYGAEVVVCAAHYVEPTEWARDYMDRVERDKVEVEGVLGKQVQPLRAAGIGVNVVVTWGDPATVILDAIEREQVDLVAMTTHGRSGFQRWLLGSVAEKVLRVSPRPVLLQRVRPSAV